MDSGCLADRRVASHLAWIVFSGRASWTRAFLFVRCLNVLHACCQPFTRKLFGNSLSISP